MEYCYKIRRATTFISADRQKKTTWNKSVSDREIISALVSVVFVV